MASQHDYHLYPYEPNKALPIFFAALVSILALIHTYQAFCRHQWKRFGVTMLWGSMVWIAGFVCRALSAYSVNNVDFYICQYVLILAGPVIYAASEYFILDRLLAYLPYCTPIQPGRVLTTFLFLSSAVEALTAAGSATVATSVRHPSGKADSGLNLIKAGLLLQAVVELCFFSLVAMVEYRCRKGGLFVKRVRVVCYVLYITSIMMLVRCIFRAIQGFQEAACTAKNPNCSVIDRNEWFLWVFEVANITVFVAALAIFHPGHYLPRNSNVYLDPSDGRTERMGPGFATATNRRFVATLLDPFDIAGALSGTAAARVDRFWERENPVVGGNHSEGKSGDSLGELGTGQADPHRP